MIECGEKLSLNAKEITKRELELGHKNRSMIANNKVREAMVLYQHINNHFHKSWSINDNFNRLVIYYFGQTINNNKNQVVAISFLVNE